MHGEQDAATFGDRKDRLKDLHRAFPEFLMGR